jgi:type IX secretion system PorP/SprF family membrane protein
MKNLLLIIYFLGLLLIAGIVNAQDPVFSQFYNAPVYLNPALVGDEEGMLLNLGHRSQWRQLHDPYTTTQASVIIPYYQSVHTRPVGHIGGMGLSFYNDVSGAYQNFKTTGGNASFAYNLSLDERNTNKISFGLQIGFINKRIDTDRLQWGEQYQRFIGFNQEITPAEMALFENKTMVDITPGVFWRYRDQKGLGLIRSAYSGFAVAHMNHPDESVLADRVDQLPLLYKYHGGLIFALNDRASISANVLTLLQDMENQTNFGSFVSYSLPFIQGGIMTESMVRVGGWYRRNDAFILSTEFLTSRFSVGFSYDWNTSSLRYQNRVPGTYEVTMGIRFRDDRPPKVTY